MLCLGQALTFTPDFLARHIERRYSPTGPSANALRYATPPPDCSIMTRIELGVYSAIAQLRAHIDWRSIAAEHFEDAAPLTAMGKREHAFFAERQVAGHV